VSDGPTLKHHGRTKIIATVGPACRHPEGLAALIEAGANIFRLNMAHGEIAHHAEVLASIRKVSKQLKRPIGVLVDLAGPKIRLGELPGGQLDCKLGDSFCFIRGDVPKAADELVTTYPLLVDEVAKGNTIMLADGAVSMVVEEKTEDHIRCRVVQPGLVRSRQGLNLPGAKLSAPAMDDDDREHARWAAENGIDFIGLSFVRQAADVRELKNLLSQRGSPAQVIAKIEKPEALLVLEDIVTAADGVMVARGDLGVEIDVARMPMVQKQIIATCQRHQKPVIIATQMLESMQNSRRPTRAEVTDIANAIIDGGDACMLSGETAIGQYPCEAVEMMNQVALATEELYRDRAPLPPTAFSVAGLHPITRAVVHGAGQIAFEIKAALIVVASHSGATGLALSKQRNYPPIVGVSDSQECLRQMSLLWGIIPVIDAPTANSGDLLEFVVSWGLRNGMLRSGDHVVLVAGVGLGSGAHNMVRVHRVS
jgi:pyruvate kinase